MICFQNGDLVEFNAVEFSSLLPDGLEALQHVGKAPAPVLLGSILGEEGSQALLHVPLQVISQHTQEHVAADAPVQLVVDRTHFELHGFDLPKGLLHQL